MKGNETRAIELFAAAHKGSAELIAMQNRVATEIVGDDLIAQDATCRSNRAFEYSDLNDFEATSALSATLATHLNDRSGRYDLRVSDESTFRALWALRQMIDKTGIPYPIYVSEAVQWLQKNGKKRIRPSMLMTSDVLLHVMECYDAEVLVSRRANAEMDKASLDTSIE